jgi:hypothetical protein
MRRGKKILCATHLRCGFIPAPQHLMSRFAQERRVHFIEEPIREDRGVPEMRLSKRQKSGVKVATPLLPETMDSRTSRRTVAILIRQLFRLGFCLNRRHSRKCGDKLYLFDIASASYAGPRQPGASKLCAGERAASKPLFRSTSKPDSYQGKLGGGTPEAHITTEVSARVCIEKRHG